MAYMLRRPVATPYMVLVCYFRRADRGMMFHGYYITMLCVATDTGGWAGDMGHVSVSEYSN